jgi:hypothetical protein
MNESYEKELVIVGMTSMDGDHTAGNIKTEIEHIINGYKFNKSKCHCKFL